METKTGFVCQGCGKDVTADEYHSYDSCRIWVAMHPEDVAKVTVKHLYMRATEATQ